MEKEKRDERNSKILELYNQGMSYRKIGEVVNLSSSGVHKIVQSLLDIAICDIEKDACFYNKEVDCQIEIPIRTKK